MYMYCFSFALRIVKNSLNIITQAFVAFWTFTLHTGFKYRCIYSRTVFSCFTRVRGGYSAREVLARTEPTKRTTTGDDYRDSQRT